MAAIRTISTSPSTQSGALAGIATTIAVGASVARRIGSALRSFADSGQLGPDPQVTTSRWTGGRI